MRISTRKFSEIKKVLYDPKISGPRWTYLMVRDLPLLSREGKRCDLTIIRPDKLGREFNKTFGHTHRGRERETYRVLMGKALFVIQTMKDTDILRIRFVKASCGDRIIIPEGSFHETINIGKLPLVLLNWLPRETQNDYELIEKKHGFGYYVLVNRSGTGFSLVKNDNYREVPEAEIEEGPEQLNPANDK